MINRITSGLYAIKLSQNEIEYLVLNNESCDILLIINPLETSLIANLSLELFFNNKCNKLGILISYPTLKVVNAANVLRKLFSNALVIASSEHSTSLRSGHCYEGSCSPIDVSWEIKTKIFKISRDITAIKLNSPTPGSLGVLFNDALITYEIQSSPFGTIHYICTSKSCYLTNHGIRDFL